MNFCLAGLLIEALSGRSYEAAVYERVLTPLGIRSVVTPRRSANDVPSSRSSASRTAISNAAFAIG